MHVLSKSWKTTPTHGPLSARPVSNLCWAQYGSCHAVRECRRFADIQDVKLEGQQVC